MEVPIDFIDRSQREEQQRRVWELHEQGKIRKEIARELKMSRSHVTTVLQQVAAARGVELIDGRKRRSRNKSQ